MPKEEAGKKVELEKELQDLVDKYNEDPAAFAKGYRELEKKLSKQGEEVGTLRKKADDSEKAMTQLSEYTKQAKPIVDWYTQNQAWLQQAVQGQANKTAAPATATGVSILTPDEQTALINAAVQNMQQKILAPWAQQFTQQVETYAKKQRDELEAALNQRNQTSMQILWNSLERGLPKERVDSLRAYHEEALRFADPSKLKPLELADEMISTKAQLAEFKEKVAKYEKEKEDAAKAAIPSYGNGSGLFAPKSDNKDNKSVPESRHDRLKAVMQDVQTQHGNEGLEQLFGRPTSVR
jgi:hypothetical protein